MKGTSDLSKSKLQICIPDFLTPRLLFFAGYISILFVRMYENTMFPRYEEFRYVFIGFGAVCITLKLFLFDVYTLKELLPTLAMAALTVLSTVIGGNIIPLVLVLLIIGAKDIDFRDILKVYLITVISVMLVAFAAAMLGLIENLKYGKAGSYQYALGICFPNDFGAHVFFAFLAVFYLKASAGRLRFADLVLSALAGAFTWKVCMARLDSGCLWIMSVVFGIGLLCSNHGIKLWPRAGGRAWTKLCDFLGAICIPVAAAFSIAGAFLFGKGNGFFVKLNELLSGRFKLGYEGFINYGVKLFGQEVELVGAGRTTGGRTGYNYLDCSFHLTLIIYGLAFFCIMLTVFVIISRKYKGDWAMQCCIMLIALNCIVAHHLTGLEYIPFSLALLTAPGAAASPVAKVLQREKLLPAGLKYGRERGYCRQGKNTD